MQQFQRINSYLLFALNGVLVVLAIFQAQLQVPPLFAVGGRLHPLLLHLPIGFIVTTALLFLIDRKTALPGDWIPFLLHTTALVAAVTACAGVLLSAEGGYDPVVLTRHLVSGTVVSLACAGLALLSRSRSTHTYAFFFTLCVVALVATGHWGGVLTHGEDYLWQPLQTESTGTRLITDSTTFYEAAIQPVLNAKCISCHNPRKAKGKLVLSSLAQVLQGGEHGPVWVAGAPEESRLMQRILLPLEHEEHMPPEGKAQLSSRELTLLELWIQRGADTTQPWTALPPSDSLRLLAGISTSPAAKKDYGFDFASADEVARLNTPYRTVQPVAANEPALAADFFLRSAFNISMLDELHVVRDQLVHVNLTGMQIEDRDLERLAQFQHLEKVIVNNTAVGKEIPADFFKLQRLQSLAVSGTRATFSFLKQAAQLPALKEVFMWNTSVSAAEAAQLATDFPHISWVSGYTASEVLTLTPPILLNDDLVSQAGRPIRFKHNIRGTRILYTTDGSPPDSVMGLAYQTPIEVDRYSVITVRACREGWYCSPVQSYHFFYANHQPDSAILLHLPDNAYRGGGAPVLYDFKKGTADSFREKAWIGYRQRPFAALFHFKNPQAVREVVVSVALNMGAYLVMPQSVEVWGGTDPQALKRLAVVAPAPYTSWQSVRVEGVRVPLPQTTHAYYKIVATPVPRLPEFISKKPEKGWLFVDEVFFN